ncbi:ricin-type beta-trefoil lectin domain protein [Kitasatospora sp. HPMI-4]|uniref:ricin-type beta-trefoil lectin domain protein n=1 Tax=Kitasatospora sp. HPMI-4 TaxID=3448443 RepID=UPI003F1CB58D
MSQLKRAALVGALATALVSGPASLAQAEGNVYQIFNLAVGGNLDSDGSGPNAITFPTNEGPFQRWNIEPAAQGYRFRDDAKQECLQAPAVNWRVVTMQPCDSQNPLQQWAILSAGEGQFYIAREADHEDVVTTTGLGNGLRVQPNGDLPTQRWETLPA